ncbi:hypothetical protein [Bartonella apis]|uniref:hypothetical protein n=1 Tax=Bartonella apis TaxID=1686310 RepID=UPI0025DC592B|nr:hypothetical protein [uncultured Bartonella sp.]
MTDTNNAMETREYRSDAILFRLDDCLDYVRVARDVTDRYNDDGSRYALHTLITLIEKELNEISVDIDEAFHDFKNGGAVL